MRHSVRQRVLTTLILAIAAVTLTVPLWASLSSDGQIRRTNVLHASLQLEGPRLPQPVAEAASLLLTGAFLIGLASLVRRSN
jgi:hypothetical protein